MGLNNMIRKNFLVFSCIAFIAVVLNGTYPALAEDTQEKVFNAKSYTLDNGLQIYVVENHRAPVVTHMVWYRVGAADEAVGKSGIAHFLEHLLFKGQSDKNLGDIKPGGFSKIVRSLGGEDNAFTSQDYTAYFQSIASENLETVMNMEAGRMRGLNPPPEEVVSENKVILEERRQRTDNDPRAQMQEQMEEALFPNHPYAKPVIGWFHEMESLTWDDAKSFYDLHYAPNNALLVVSGDVTGERVLEIAKKTYGLLEKRDIPERVRPKSPPFIARSSVTLAHEMIREPIFMRTYRVPGYRQNKDDSLALQVLEEIIGSGSSSRLYKSLVIEKKIAVNIGLGYDPNAWDDGTISVSATPVPNKNILEVQAAIDGELRKLIKDGISDKELADALQRLEAEAVYARDSVAGPAMILGYSLITGSTLDDIENWPQNIRKVTKEQVQDVAKRWLNPDTPSLTPPVNGYLIPKVPPKDDKNETPKE